MLKSPFVKFILYNPEAIISKNAQKDLPHYSILRILYCITTTVCKSGLKQELFDENSFSFCLVQRVLTYFFYLTNEGKSMINSLIKISNPYVPMCFGYNLRIFFTGYKISLILPIIHWFISDKIFS